MSILNQYSSYFTDFIKVGMDGYDNKWNIKTESSEANDISFLNSVISQLKSFSNVDSENITLLGSSNGAALVIKALLELPENTFNNGIFIASQLITDQYRDSKFWFNEFPSREYINEISLPERNRIISFHGTEDSVIDYNGGINLNDNGINWLNRIFHSAIDSSYFFALGRGYMGPKIFGNGEDTINPLIKKYGYSDYGVFHYKVILGNHGLSGYKNDVVSIILSHIE